MDDASSRDISKISIDRRLANVEQILPTLATKDELHTLATKADLRTLATKQELSTLATKEELRAKGERLQRHMDIVGESLRSGIQLLAEHLASVMPKRTGASS
jgi:hypothetical protein